MNKKIFAFSVTFALVLLSCTLTEDRTNSPPTPTETPQPTLTPTPARLPEPTKTGNCKVTTDALNLRNYPSTNAPIMEYLYSGDTLSPIPTPSIGDWIAVRTESGKTGFVNSIFTNCREAK